ncbi:MAG TPA: hypothetical protein PLD25_20070 [Chloroflexota bacterium]|nr:hypothetical protein [Chloroflexota bacterium]
MTQNADFIGLLVGLTLTLCIYSYLFIGDKIPYRLAIHILVGASAAYAAVVVVQQVFEPVYRTITENPSPADAIYLLAPILLALFLLLHRLRAASWAGSITLALLVGVGAAIAFLGALTGTLWPQLTGTYANTSDPLRGLLIAVLAALTLLSFQFTSFRAGGSSVWERAYWQQGIVWLGRAVLMITFGALFAALLNTSFVLLAGRIYFYMQAFNR